MRNPYAISPHPVSKFLVRTPWVRSLARQVLAQRWRSQLKWLVLKKAAKPPMDERARDLLREIYRGEFERLPQVLGRELPWQLSISGAAAP